MTGEASRLAASGLQEELERLVIDEGGRLELTLCLDGEPLGPLLVMP